MKLKTEEAMKNSQIGFRQGRGTVDAIFIVRQIIEKAREHQVPLRFNFIDFKSAFDTVWRKALWRMMIAIGVDTKIVNIIEALYKDTECAIVIDGHITEWFKVNIGVRQGCILSPTLFNIFLEFVMKELKSLDQDLQMKNTLSVDIRYADDTTLISTVFNKLNISSGELEEACRKLGMKINGGKCKIISTSTDSIKIDGKNVDHVEERLYNALILPIATYASETWTLKSEDTRKLTVFEMRCLRSILGTTIADRIRNTDIITRLLQVNLAHYHRSHKNTSIKLVCCCQHVVNMLSEDRRTVTCTKPIKMISLKQDREEDHQRDGLPKYKLICFLTLFYLHIREYVIFIFM